jgi:hypothetical protein
MISIHADRSSLMAWITWTIPELRIRNTASFTILQKVDVITGIDQESAKLDSSKRVL